LHYDADSPKNRSIPRPDLLASKPVMGSQKDLFVNVRKLSFIALLIGFNNISFWLKEIATEA